MVYALQSPKTRLVKLGRTSRLAVRIRQLNYEFDDDLKILAVFSEEKWPELHLHRLFRRLRQHREWFLPDHVLLKFIKEHGQEWTPEWDAPGGYYSVPVDRHVRWMLSQVAAERGVSMEQLVDELLRARANEMFHGLRQGVAVKS